MSTCKHCKRPIYSGTFLGEPTWRLVIVAYQRSWLCDARGMKDEHEPVEEAPRKAVVERGGMTVEQVSAYLPSNYKVVDQDADTITIEGEDYAGWTLDDYVIPRLASGLIFAKEVTS